MGREAAIRHVSTAGQIPWCCCLRRGAIINTVAAATLGGQSSLIIKAFHCWALSRRPAQCAFMALPVDVDLSTAALILCGDQARCSNCKHQRKHHARLAAKPKILLEKIVCLELLLPWITFAAIELLYICDARKKKGGRQPCRSSNYLQLARKIIVVGGRSRPHWVGVW